MKGWVVCPICWTGYSVVLRRSGSRCNDLSQNQARPCVGRVIPDEQLKLAEFRPRPSNQVRKEAK